MNSLEASISELKSLSLFQQLSPQQIMELCEGGRACYTRHRDMLFQAGEEAHFFGIVISGAYKLMRSSLSGEDVIVHFAIPGDIVAAFIMSQPHSKFPITATAMGPSRFLKLPRENFIHFWQKNPEFILKVQSTLACRVQQLIDEKSLVKAPLARKLSALLLNLLDKSPHHDEGLIPLQLTRKEIADTLGSSVESIIRIMSDWSKKGVLETNDKQIKILKVDQLIHELNAE